MVRPTRASHPFQRQPRRVFGRPRVGGHELGREAKGERGARRRVGGGVGQTRRPRGRRRGKRRRRPQGRIRARRERRSPSGFRRAVFHAPQALVAAGSTRRRHEQDPTLHVHEQRSGVWIHLLAHGADADVDPGPTGAAAGLGDQRGDGGADEDAHRVHVRKGHRQPRASERIVRDVTLPRRQAVRRVARRRLFPVGVRRRGVPDGGLTPTCRSIRQVRRFDRPRVVHVVGHRPGGEQRSAEHGSRCGDGSRGHGAVHRLRRVLRQRGQRAAVFPMDQQVQSDQVGVSGFVRERVRRVGV
mmetsp:Transcript_6267/g.25958  ORF Transcript_6267/g.25958 Transcript_6267/m.25958 type:complete len:300 (-) Transcript_6267:1538-2437(-)